MTPYRLSIALILFVFLAYPDISMAFYTRGTVTREISYDRLSVTQPPAGVETYRPVASGVLVNNTRTKIVLSAELSFCNVFGEPLGSATVYCTVPPLKKISFNKYMKGEAPVSIKDAHHVEWTILDLKKI